MIDFSSTLSFCGLDFFPSKKPTLHHRHQWNKKATQAKHLEALCALWSLQVEWNFFCLTCFQPKPGFTLKDQSFLHQLATNKFDGVESNYPISSWISIMFLVGGHCFGKILATPKTPNSSPRLCAVMPYKVQKSWWGPSATGSEKIAGCLWNRKYLHNCL